MPTLSHEQLSPIRDFGPGRIGFLGWSKPVQVARMEEDIALIDNCVASEPRLQI